MSAQTPRPCRVGFILAPRFTLTAFAGFVDALRLAGDQGDRSGRVLCDWQVLAANALPIAASCGMLIAPTQELGEPQRFDLIVVVGGLVQGHTQVSAASLRFLQRAAAAQVPLAALCTGSFVLARAGLLDGHLACVSWFHHDEFAALFPHVRVTSKQLYVVDRDRMTCAGGTSVVHLAAHWINRRIGHAPAVKALRILLEDQALPSRTLQPEQVLTRKSTDALVHQAMLLIEQRLSQAGPVSQAVTDLSVGARQLQRRFQLDIGMSPAQYRSHLRLQRAQWLLEHSALGVNEVALECGFQDGSNLTRSIKQHLAQTPRQIRRQARQADDPTLTAHSE